MFLSITSSWLNQFAQKCQYWWLKECLLLRQRERLRSIVMSMYVCGSVCGSVCLSVRHDICGTTRAIFTKCFVHVARVRSSVLLRQVYDRPHRVSLGRGFLPHWQCIYLRNHTRDLYQVSVHVACAGGSILLRPDMFTIGRIAYRREGVFFPVENALSTG